MAIVRRVSVTLVVSAALLASSACGSSDEDSAASCTGGSACAAGSDLDGSADGAADVAPEQLADGASDDATDAGADAAHDGPHDGPHDGAFGEPTDAASELAPAGSLPFLSPCSADSECATGLCYPYPEKGPHCTRLCESDADCPAPSPGCNPINICRAL